MNANVNVNGDQMKNTFVPTSDIRQALDTLRAAAEKRSSAALMENALLRAYFTKLCWAVSDSGRGDLVTGILQEMLEEPSRPFRVMETP